MKLAALARAMKASKSRGMTDCYKRGGRLTAAERHAMPKSEFALPGERYPINDKAHARNALARVSQHGTSEEKAKVRAKVHRKYPDIGSDK